MYANVCVTLASYRLLKIPEGSWSQLGESLQLDYFVSMLSKDVCV